MIMNQQRQRQETAPKFLFPGASHPNPSDINAIPEAIQKLQKMANTLSEHKHREFTDMIQ